VKASTGSAFLLHPADNALAQDGWRGAARLLGYMPEPPPMPDQALPDHDVVEADGVRLHVIHTPGHTQGSVCYYRAEAPLEAPLDAPLMAAMTRALLAEDPGSRVVPYCMSGGTDAKHFAQLGIAGYGFTPLRLPPGYDYHAMFHGVDERVPVSALHFGVSGRQVDDRQVVRARHRGQLVRLVHRGAEADNMRCLLLALLRERRAKWAEPVLAFVASQGSWTYARGFVDGIAINGWGNAKDKPSDADLHRNPLIGGSKGTTMAHVTPEELEQFEGANTFEGDVENDTNSMGGIDKAEVRNRRRRPPRDARRRAQAARSPCQPVLRARRGAVLPRLARRPRRGPHHRPGGPELQRVPAQRLGHVRLLRVRG